MGWCWAVMQAPDGQRCQPGGVEHHEGQPPISGRLEEVSGEARRTHSIERGQWLALGEQ
jgi:hypothetical protein